MKQLIILLLFSFTCSAQVRLQGTVMDKDSESFIAYANIGIEEKGLGTVSDGQGQFELSVPEELMDSYLSFSHIGYKKEKVRISEFFKDSSGVVLYLEPTTHPLQEVTVVGEEQGYVGYRARGGTVQGYFETKGLGCEGGSLIKNNKESRLVNFYMYIGEFTFDTLRFRLNLYDERWNKPKRKINAEDIIFTLSKADTGIFELPLRDKQIIVDGDFFSTIELIEIVGERNPESFFSFSAIPHKQAITVKRPVSLDKWKKLRGYALCFWFTTEE